MVDLSNMFAIRFRVFSSYPNSLKGHYANELDFGGKTPFYRKNPSYFVAHCDQIVALFDEPSTPLEISH